MGDEDGSRELPQRSRGAARGGSDRSAPVLSEEVRQRIQAAVKAERADASNGVSAPRQPGHALKNGTATPPQPVRPQPAKTGAAPPQPVQAGAAGQPASRRPARISLIVLTLVLVAVGSLVTLVSLHLTNSSGGHSSSVSPAVLRHQEARTRSQAASWVISQVDPDSMVACDQVMCGELRADKYPASKLVTLGPTSQPPVTSVVVVVTEAVRELFGSSLDSAWAPAVLTSIGSGTAQVTIRLIAAHGALAYQNQLTAGLVGRKNFGNVLIDGNRIKLSSTARQQLSSGQVDARLVLAITSLAGAEPIDILGFGNVGSGASAGVPLRYADLATTDSAASLSGAAYLRAMQARLSQLDSQYRPASSQTVGHVFRVAFTAPSPLGSISGTP